MRNLSRSSKALEAIQLHGVCFAIGPRDSMRGSIEIADGQIQRIHHDRSTRAVDVSKSVKIDLNGFLVLPGLVNAHDHLQFALYPNLGNPPYQNYIEWGEDIHATRSDVIAKYKSIPKDVRLWWGGIRNLLCGVTTVSHHDFLWPELQTDDFPVSVVQHYGWAHSPALGGDLCEARSTTPDGGAFLIHACEGVDELARQEIFALDGLGVLDASTVLVHGLALDQAGVAIMQARHASLIVCPSSNQFLFKTTPDIKLLEAIDNVALGNDSPLTAAGDLLHEIRFAIQYCGIAPDRVYRMVTETAARILRVKNGEGTIIPSGTADLIAVRDTGDAPAERLCSLSTSDIELVIIRGQVQLASEAVWTLLPPQIQHGLEPLWIDGCIRWLRAPVKDLLRSAEMVLSHGEVRLDGRLVKAPESIIDTSPAIFPVNLNELTIGCGEK